MTAAITLFFMCILAGFGFGIGVALVWEVIIRAGGNGRFVSLTVSRVAKTTVEEQAAQKVPG